MSAALRSWPWIAVFFLLGYFLLVLSIGWPLTHSGTFSDSVSYLFMADWFSPWRAPTIGHTREFALHSIYPPLYPYVLALGGGGASDLSRANLIQSVLMTAAVWACYRWAASAASSRVIGAAAACSLALAPVLLPYSLEISSEPLFLILLFLVLTELDRLARAELGDGRMTLVAALAGLAILVRLAALPLLLVAAVWIWRRSRGVLDRTLRLGVLLAPWVLWTLLRTQAPSEVGYSSLTWEQLRGTWLAAPWVTVLDQARALVSGLTADLNDHGTARLGALLLVLLALPRLLGTLRSGTPSALFVLLYAAMVAVWPYPAEAKRLTGVLIPFLVAYGGLTLYRQCGPHLAVARFGITALCGLLLAAHGARLAERWYRPLPAELEPYRRTVAWFSADEPERVAEILIRSRVMAEMLAQVIDPDGCAQSNSAEFLSLYSNIPVYPLPDVDRVRAHGAHALLCPWVVYVGIESAQDFHPATTLLRVLSERAQPVWVSATEGNPSATAAALFHFPLPRGDATRQELP